MTKLDQIKMERFERQSCISKETISDIIPGLLKQEFLFFTSYTLKNRKIIWFANEFGVQYKKLFKYNTSC